ncbi:hypothetical protein BCR41DRAFT_298103 [Lobosporangium transversale]|uniref:C2H2-type domain-containing protein n=1 Tax=Lobosporangium transversale TaxID=64571 RepID=A0A1Y2H5W2_9FUNG|nr:hypothetical protein BCR41DRAFT_298103 [Lobosporangium transversale]ORZ29083.1 hypothetical protein BCR41DRAFT_298103 [Lobosporangium transversale]|eukprot:XP_021886756.1 hypothetical protein BCR41DRAFT_298103 [Lobosporangium transversale]
MRVSALPAQAPAITGSTTAKRRGRKSNKTPTIHKCIITGCSSEFDRKYTLQQHIFTHLPKSQRPFACTHEGCSKRFNRWADKMRHERVHTGESSFQCKFCETSFSRPDARLNHYRRVHRE